MGESHAGYLKYFKKMSYICCLILKKLSNSMYVCLYNVYPILPYLLSYWSVQSNAQWDRSLQSPILWNQVPKRIGLGNLQAAILFFLENIYNQ